MAHQVNAWQCDFCHRCFSRKVNAMAHESSCKLNPARRSCYTCKHMDPHGIVGHIDCEDPMFGDLTPAWATPESLELRGKFCDHFKTPLADKPYFIDCEMTNYEYDDQAQPIPGTCCWWEAKDVKQEV